VRKFLWSTAGINSTLSLNVLFSLYATRHAGIQQKSHIWLKSVNIELLGSRRFALFYSMRGKVWVDKTGALKATLTCLVEVTFVFRAGMPSPSLHTAPRLCLVSCCASLFFTSWGSRHNMWPTQNRFCMPSGIHSYNTFVPHLQLKHLNYFPLRRMELEWVPEKWKRTSWCWSSKDTSRTQHPRWCSLFQKEVLRIVQFLYTKYRDKTCWDLQEYTLL